MTVAEDVAFWLDSYADTTRSITDAAVLAAVRQWSAFTRWYDDAAVATLAASMAALSATSQQQTSGAAATYVGAVATLLGASAPPAPNVPTVVIRNGVPAALVHTRPAEAYKRAIALGASHAEALVKSGIRAAGVMGSDLTLQQREAERRMLEQAGVTAYRRIIRPEMSKTGTCGLCIAAADRVYSTGELMPIHPPSCNCTVLPIMGEVGGPGDPGLTINGQDISALYASLGATDRSTLSNARYQVNTHGEYGPVLTREGDAFRGPDRVALEDDVPRAARLLTKAAPVLTLMQGGDWEGPDRDGALAYQQSFVGRLEDILATAA